MPRILEAYRRYGLKQTFFVPAWCIEQYPEAVEGMVKDGHEVGFHGYIHEAPNSLTQSRGALLDAAFDRRHRAPYRQAAARQPLAALQLLQSHRRPPGRGGLPLRLIADGRRRALRARRRKRARLVELPANWATDDWPPYVHSIDLNYVMQIMAPERAMEGFLAEFEAMRQAGGGLWIAIWHPFVSGRLSRWLRIEKMIEYMLGTGEVWFATLEDIARHVLACRDDGSWTPRVDALPYYREPVVPGLRSESSPSPRPSPRKRGEGVERSRLR